MSELTVEGLRALLDAAARPGDAPMDARYEPAPDGAGWLHLETADVLLPEELAGLGPDGSRRVAVAVPVGLLRELLGAAAERGEALRRVADAERLSEDTGRERNLRNEQLTDLRTAVLGRLPMPGERHSIAVDAAISHRGDIAYEKARAEAAEARVAELSELNRRIEGDAIGLAERLDEADARVAALEAAFAAGVPPSGTVRVERGVEHDDGKGGRYVRPESPTMTLDLLAEIVRRGIGNPVWVWREVPEPADIPWRTGTPPEAPHVD